MAYRKINPTDEVDYTYNFSGYLGTGVTVSSATWTSVPSGLTFASGSNSGQTASIRISDAVAGEIYKVFCEITDSNGQVLKQEALTLRGANE